MRFKLKQFVGCAPRRYSASIEAFGKESQKPRRATALLVNVSTADGEAVCDHVWIICPAEFAGLQRLDRIEFTADVSSYQHNLAHPCARRALGAGLGLSNLRDVTVTARNLGEWRKSFDRLQTRHGEQNGERN